MSDKNVRLLTYEGIIYIHVADVMAVLESESSSLSRDDIVKWLNRVIISEQQKERIENE